MLDEFLDFVRTRKKANLVMVASNILVFIILSFMGNTESSSFMLEHGACFTPYILGGEYWRLFTGMFLHFGITHIVYNMLSLIFLGDMLEAYLGPVRYLLIYLLGGLAGNLLSMALDLRTRQAVVSAGASGAIFAVIGALLYITIRRRKYTGDLMVKRFALMTVLMIAEGFTQSGTDNAAHVGGFLAGILLSVLLYRTIPVR